jgi:hypothetical protein
MQQHTAQESIARSCGSIVGYVVGCSRRTPRLGLWRAARNRMAAAAACN